MKMKKKTKENNRGFSLVELIVVIAIMGILAVTLAPRLSAYVEKAKVASDKEIVNTIMTAAKVGLSDEAIYNDFIGLKTPVVSGVYKYSLYDSTEANSLYVRTGKVWTPNKGGSTPFSPATNKFALEIWSIVDDFTFKATNATNSQITVELNINTNTLKVSLDYADDSEVDYEVSD